MVPLDLACLDALVEVAFAAVLDSVVPVDIASVDLAYAADDIVAGRHSDCPSFDSAVLVVEESQFVDQTLLDLVV